MANTFALRLKDDRLITLPKPAVMGIINMSPNSFFRPHSTIEAALITVENMINEGASLIDVGGEATNPSVDLTTEEPSLQREIDRVVPLIAEIKKRFDVLVSVDTSRPRVMKEAVAAGADWINDQRALQMPGALETIVALKTPVCLMHFFDPPRTPGSSSYTTLLQTIKSQLRHTIDRCLSAGIRRDRLVIDPGFGQGNYGKNAGENFFLLAHLAEFVEMGFPVLSGWSRKSMIGEVLKADPTDRLYGSIAADTIATYQGASIIRTHDVKASDNAVKVAAEAHRMKQIFME